LGATDGREKMPDNQEPPKPPQSKSLRNLQESWNRFQPIVKEQTIKTLKGLDNFLQSAIGKLGTDSKAAANSQSPASGGKGASKSPSTPVVDKFLPSLEQIQRFWNSVLQKIRSLLPASTSEKLSDWGLTGVIAGIAILIFWIGVAISSGGSPEQVAEVPATQLQPPSELTAPNRPKSVKVVVPTPVPFQLTPEQSLIASVQSRVENIVKEYSNEIVRSLEVNFPQSRLDVKIGDRWYDISSQEQDKIISEISDRSQKYNFQKLQLTDPQGTLVARSPVVGKNLIVLRRDTFKI
jgi:hypothetical protein